jgi:hypothetical protein
MKRLTANEEESKTNCENEVYGVVYLIKLTVDVLLYSPDFKSTWVDKPSTLAFPTLELILHVRKIQ